MLGTGFLVTYLPRVSELVANLQAHVGDYFLVTRYFKLHTGRLSLHLYTQHSAWQVVGL